MPLMPPGSQTGVYYIPVGNLPWNTTWKKLKDHARNRQPDGSALAIIHANVYPGPTSTSGWVSVQGLADFRAAIYHMNHVAMEDPPRASRTLQADSRNETQPVMLGEGSAESSSPKLQRVQQQTKLQALLQHTNAPSPRETFGDWQHQHPPTRNSTPMSTSFSDNSYYQPPSPHYNHTQPFNGFISQNEYIPFAQPGMVLAPMSTMSPIPAPMPQRVFLFPAGQQSQPMLQLFTSNPPQAVAVPQSQQMLPPLAPPAPPPQPDPSPKVVKTEARKIIITGLPLTATQKDVQELIQSVSSTSSHSFKSRHHNTPDGTRYYLQHLELAKQSNGAPKGHAFAVLESHSTAQRTIDALNGLGWRSRKLQARFAKEGMESNNRSTRHGKRSEAGAREVYDSAIPKSAKGEGREPHLPRGMLQEPQYRYFGNNTVMEADDHLAAQYSAIQIDCRGDYSSSSSSLASVSKKEESMLSVSSLSSEGEKERDRKMVSEGAGSHTPMVVDGSSCCKRSR
ncbi:hypothetical protein BKA61DRAFT_201871 [Leptodontidium sp. MPI-SDFR-AT-0119]|nr:hypothetical protein BKA61DRAFT_201871 [Leptodontidium sp. MPI-SDFR-AT-0119]